ncbi:MAG TPA: hypothetical protein VK907_00185 [Phnomibacter sp.]|nr:hypothetical protein [Phnomibacter sp.]
MMQIFLDIPDSLQGDIGYKVGYYFGAWLPFLLLVLVAFIVIRAGQRRK